MRWRLKIDEEKIVDVELVSATDTTFTFKVGDKQITLSHPQVFPFSLSCDQVELSLEAWNKKNWRAVSGAQTYSVESLGFESENKSSQNEIRTQMPGRVLKILVKAGDQIEANQTLLIMEAMKMENEIRSTASGKVKSISVAPQASVESGALLMELEPNT
ncbi:MAG: hypothetical protein J0L93_08510 [Deltaproteobacteria bacterium]|nr:hypothetical protein [Deltaproteobacteria bacterium]